MISPVLVVDHELVLILILLLEGSFYLFLPYSAKQTPSEHNHYGTYDGGACALHVGDVQERRVILSFLQAAQVDVGQDKLPTFFGHP